MDTRKRPSFYYHGITWFSTNFLSRVARSMGALRQVRIARLAGLCVLGLARDAAYESLCKILLAVTPPDIANGLDQRNHN